MEGARHLSKTYAELKAGEWVQPRRRGYKSACCDCGLVHRMDFRVRGGRAQFRVYRANRETAMMRRYQPDHAIRPHDRKRKKR